MCFSWLMTCLISSQLQKFWESLLLLISSWDWPLPLFCLLQRWYVKVRVVRRIFMFYLTFVWSLMLVPRVRTNDYEKIFWQGRCRCGTQPSQIGKNAYVNGSFPLYTAGTCFGLQSDGIHKTLLLAQQFGKAAVQNVKNLPESLERTALEAIVDDVLTRTK